MAIAKVFYWQEYVVNTVMHVMQGMAYPHASPLRDRWGIMEVSCNLDSVITASAWLARMYSTGDPDSS